MSLLVQRRGGGAPRRRQPAAPHPPRRKLSSPQTRRRRLSVPLILMTALMIALGAAGPAAAAPQEPVMTLTRLQELLTASSTGTVDAIFKTVVKGSMIVDVPCKIEGVVPQASIDNGDLLMFKASGPVIDQAGGIAAGMSGSPIYVVDPDEPSGSPARLVGAVSYGEYFTGNGLGLATPIEHMMTLESDFNVDLLAQRLAQTIDLATPVSGDGATISKIVVAPSTAAARRIEPGPHTAVLRPLSTFQLGGVPAGGPVAAALKKSFAAQGIDLRVGLAAGAAGSDANFAAPLVPGSSVGQLFMRGDVWFGGVGTTTYTTADGKLVGFGHPSTFDGYIRAYLTNANVIGLWNSAMDPHKVVAPGKVRGTITVDSGPGIAGLLGDAAIPADVPFTCTATNSATGKTVTTTSYATQWAADQFKYPYWNVFAMAFYPALYRATGDQQFDGHLTYSLTVQMTDGTHDYTLTRANTWEDSYGYDANYLVLTDLAALFSTLTSDPDGTINPHITGVNLDCTLSPGHNRARIVAVDAPGGVQVGTTTVKVTMYTTGSMVPVTVDVPLTIPAGMPTNGTIYAKAPHTNVESMGDGWYGWTTYSSPDTDPPRTLADLVAALDNAPGNDQLLVAYAPPSDEPGDLWDEGEPWGEDAVVARVPMNRYLSGQAAKGPASISISQESWPAVAGRPLTLKGTIYAEGSDLSNARIKIYSRDVGATADRLLAEVPVVAGPPEEGGEPTFTATVKARHTATFTAVWPGDANYLPSSADTFIEVRAAVRLAARVSSTGVRLTATVTPSDAGGKIAFQALKKSGSGILKQVAVNSKGTASFTWRLKKGTYRVVARFLGSQKNAPASSKPLRVVVR